MQEFITYILTPLVEDIKAVEINIQEEESQTRVTLNIPQSDMGHIIGKHGKTINNLRQIVRLWGNLHNRQVLLNIQEDGAPATESASQE